MTDYDRGRRDAIRDVVHYLVTDLEAVPEPVRKMLVGLCREVEKFSTVAPQGYGKVW